MCMSDETACTNNGLLVHLFSHGCTPQQSQAQLQSLPANCGPCQVGQGSRWCPHGRCTCSHDLVAASSPCQHTNADQMRLNPVHASHSLVTSKRAAHNGFSRQQPPPLRAHLQPGSLP